MKIRSGQRALGFTLAEMIMSVGCGTLVLAAVVAAGVALQKSYAAVESYSTTEADQLRVLDYISMDCRRAVSASVNAVTVNGVSETALVLTLPQYYNSATFAANTPTVSGTYPSYGTDIVTITYEKNGTNFTREVKVTDSTGATVRSDYTFPIAKNVSTFAIDPTKTTATNVSCSITFLPAFLRNSGTGSWWSGQYSPNDHAPANNIGSDGDWYVINNTASNATTVGDVYYKSGGSFSKVENIQATTVAINGFLRNVADSTH